MRTPSPRSYEDKPLLVFWEMTKACPLACKHCRAFAQRTGMPGELTTEEGKRFLSSLAGFGTPPPILVLTGGDPLARPDFLPLVRFARESGCRVALAPAVSDSLAGQALHDIRSAGIRTISLSLDGATAPTHEGIRQVPGHFKQTIDAIEDLVARGFTVQINTTVMSGNVEELADIAVLLRDLGVAVWEVFFLIQVGRGADVGSLTPDESEDVAHFLYDAAGYGFIVRTVEAPFFRRVVAWRSASPVDAATKFGLGPLYNRLAERLASQLGPPTTSPKATSAGTRDGNGILFVGHDGEVLPAGFLPLPLGSVRERSVVDIYRDNPVLRSIRAAEFTGRCGRCDFRTICGGSRSRAFAAYGDPLAEDPACAYDPAAM
ncbi:MAG: TIGR04053 family radical SAM/SPASM domain-containing protein [Candidatus Nanopelagicales bacterium]|nr:TIGR04053 family radical SAM/SPASM domain-containing protein [Candidatus Nanopelagicales bacterium]